MKNYLAILLLFGCSIECMDKLKKLKVWKSDHEEIAANDILRQIVDKRGKTTLKYAKEAALPWYRNISLATCFEGSIWIVGGMSLTAFIAFMHYFGALDVDSSTIGTEVAGILGAGWGAKQVWRAVNNRPANERLMTSEMAYGPEIQALIALHSDLEKQESTSEEV